MKSMFCMNMPQVSGKKKNTRNKVLTKHPITRTQVSDPSHQNHDCYKDRWGRQDSGVNIVEAGEMQHQGNMEGCAQIHQHGICVGGQNKSV